MHLLDDGIENKPEASLNRLCDVALEAQIYGECVHYYPFVLGAQPVRPIDLAAFYAAIPNEGLRPVPYVVEYRGFIRGGPSAVRRWQLDWFGRAATLLMRLDVELRACWRPFDDEEITTAGVDCCRT